MGAGDLELDMNGISCWPVAPNPFAISIYATANPKSCCVYPNSIKRGRHSFQYLDKVFKSNYTQGGASLFTQVIAYKTCRNRGYVDGICVNMPIIIPSWLALVLSPALSHV